MRIVSVLVAALALSACATSALERQAGSAAQGDCWDQAEAYIRANMANIANEWREHEKYKRYQLCLSRKASSNS